MFAILMDTADLLQTAYKARLMCSRTPKSPQFSYGKSSNTLLSGVTRTLDVRASGPPWTSITAFKSLRAYLGAEQVETPAPNHFAANYFQCRV